jgi:transposase-like protein
MGALSLAPRRTDAIVRTQKERTPVAASVNRHNLIEQDHRAIRRRWRAALCFRA